MLKPPALLLVTGLIWYGSIRAQVSQPGPRVLVMECTAFARAPQPTAAGTEVREGTVAADPAVLPLGTRIRVVGTHGFDGNYLVTDTGAAVKGRHIDIYLPSEIEAKQFGTKTVRVYIRQMGKGKADAQKKNAASVAK